MMREFAVRSVTLAALAIAGGCLLAPGTGMAANAGEMTMDAVRYEDFGARGDGTTDDVEAIARAHAFANERGLSVRANDDATYYIGGRDLPVRVQTSTDFGSARFVIDDTAVQNIRAHVFEVRSALPSVKPQGITSLTRNQRVLPVSLPGRSVVQITNANVRRFIRKGLNQNRGTAQTDVVLVDADGTVDADTPILWDFDQITDITAHPVDETTLTLRGGRFTTIANAAESRYTYHARGIHIRRSNVVVDGLEHRIMGEGDQGAPYIGFLNIAQCAEVTVRNSVFTGRKTYRTIGSAGRPVSMGSYGINLNRALNVSFVNCRQTNDINDRTYWGIMGSNYSKNLLLDNCTFSRFDAHQGVYNATIRNSTIGHMGVQAIGKGTLLLENTTVRAGRLINFRQDYGSTWEGEVIIRNCVFVPRGAGRPTLIGGSNTGDHDFGYTCHMPERITIDRLHIDDSSVPADRQGAVVLADFNPRWRDDTYVPDHPQVVTREVVLNDVTTASGRPVRLSDNAFLFKDVIVRGLDAE